MKIKIAVVQFKIEPSSDENLKKAEKYIEEAALKKANLIVFPEYFLDEGALASADRKNIYQKHFQKLARKYQIDIVPGSFLEKEKEQLYNSTCYLDSEGKIVGKYRKNHLWKEEKNTLTPGEKVSVFNTKFGKIGLAICWDLMFPETFRKMVKKGVEIVLCPSYWLFQDAGEGTKYNPNSEIVLVDSLCIERAFENELILVFCNVASQKDSRISGKSIGHSQITEPFKGVIKKLAHHEEEMFIEEVDTDILKVAEKAYEIRKEMKKKA